MANVASVGGAIGALNPDYRTASSDFNVNTTVIGTDGFTYRYVEAVQGRILARLHSLITNGVGSRVSRK
mgnify:CR=1 FL=1